MDQADDTYTINEYEEYDGDSDTSVYKLDRDDLDSHVKLASKAQKSFLNGQGKGMLPCLQGVQSFHQWLTGHPT